MGVKAGNLTRRRAAARSTCQRPWLVRSLLAAAALALLGSLWGPYWRMRIAAPQYPRGLHLVVYANRLTGDVREIDTLNHYIGMQPLKQGAKTERRLAIPGIVVAIGGLLLAAVFCSVRWMAVLALPTAVIAPLFAFDLALWLRDYGLNLNPKAPLSQAVKPFVPPLFGPGKVAQFDVVATFGPGFWLALTAGVLVLVALWVGRRHARGIRSVASLATAIMVLIGLSPQALADTLLVGEGAPYPTIQQALQQASAGDTLIIRGGVHPGPLVIDKALTILGEADAVLDGGGHGTVLTLAAPGTILRNLTIRGSGDVLSTEDTGILITAADVTVEGNRLEDVLFGVHVRRAPGSVVRGNLLRGKALPLPRRGDPIRVWYSDGVVLEDNTIEDGRDAVLWFSKQVTIRDNVIRRGRYGLHFMYCDQATVTGNVLTHNSVGVYLMYSARLTVTGNRMVGNRGPSGYGLGLKDMEAVRIEGNILADNRAGVFLEHASGDFTDNLIALNDVGVNLWPSSRRNRFRNNSLIDNGEQVVMESGLGVSTNEWSGNYWSDYRGYDAEQDGTGDIPYLAMRLFERLVERYPALRLYADSPAARALEFASALFPIFAPQPKLVDRAPRMQPVEPPQTSHRTRTWSAWSSEWNG